MKKSSTSVRITRKLFFSIISVLFALTSMVTASYAWFSMNTSVAVNNLTITVAAPQSLLVSTTSADATDYSARVELANDVSSPAAKFVPVAYSGICASWYQLTDAAKVAVNQAGRIAITNFTMPADGDADSSYAPATVKFNPNTNTVEVDDAQTTDLDETTLNTAAIYATAGTYVYHDRIWLKVEGNAEESGDPENPTTKQINVKAAFVNDPTSLICQALHVVFVVDGAVKATLDMGSAVTVTNNAISGYGEATYSNLLELIPNTSGKQVDIYYFLSGNDSNCFNANIVADSALSVNLTFEIDTPVQP